MSKLSNIIRNPKVIAQYIKGVYDARRDKEKTYHLAFNREANGGWYIDLPEWEGAHAQLAMVAGADAFWNLWATGSREWKCRS